AIPALDAVRMCEDALMRLRATGARVILISGNHDSARRLGFSSALIDAAGVHLRTRPEALADPVLLADDHGQVAFYGIPYLEPAFGLPALEDGETAAGANLGSGEGDRRGEDRGSGEDQGSGQDRPAGDGEPAGGPPRRDHQSVLREAVARVRADAAARAAARTVVLAHAWVTGGEVSDSERDIRVGGVGDVPRSVFDGLSYVALGHLHGQQTLADHVRYSGSPLPYSFSERHHHKGSWRVELGDGGKLSAEPVPAPVYRRLSMLRGTIEELLASREHDGVEGNFLAVTLTDRARPDAAMDRLRRRFPHVLTLAFEPDGVVADERSYVGMTTGKGDLEVAAEFVTHVRNTEPTPGERDLLAAAFEASRGETAGGGEA
ncbi:MAG: Exonuclease SbcD, partial [Actinomycetia bacterium]|nr:Exonuclease SbcD [Actinomycetes bacterium]